MFGDDDVYNFFSFGVRLGHFRYPRLVKPCPLNSQGVPTRANPTDDCEVFEDYGPELVSWLDITTGRWENFELVVPSGQFDAAGNPITVRERRWRYQAEGRLKIPETPFLVGFDGNFGKGPDDLRFGFGIRFDVGRVIQTLKLREIFETQQTQAGGGAGGTAGGGGRP